MISLSRNINNVSINRTEEQFRFKTCALPVNSSEFVCHTDRTFMKGTLYSMYLRGQFIDNFQIK